MKIKSILSCLLALSLLVFALPLSAFADDFTPSSLGYDIQYSVPYSSIVLSDVPYGTLMRVAVGNDIVECYQPHAEESTYNRLIVEKYGLFTHLFEVNKEIHIGSWTIRYIRETAGYKLVILLDGVQVKQLSTGGSSSDTLTLRYGFSLVYINGKPFIWFLNCTQNFFAGQNVNNNSNYCLISPSFSGLDSSLPESIGFSGFLLDPTAGGNSFNTEVDIPGGGQTPSTVLWDSLITCPNCGGHNISYRSSVIYSGVLIFIGQVGCVFSCRDCGAGWRGIFSSPEEFTQFGEYFRSKDFGENIQADLTLPPFFTPPSTVDLPTDVGGLGEYINSVFSALSSFTSSFNSFFSDVFSVLPAPVVGIILLGVGLVVIIGIIKAVRG